jgi:ABC-2 type transport system permease protein
MKDKSSLGRVFSVFFFLGRKARRTRFFLLLSFLPVAVAVIVKFNQAFSPARPRSGIFLFSNIIMLFYLQLIILILALFYGTSICSEEVEGKTLTYLITRPISKTFIILGKYGAYTLIVIGMVSLGLIFSFAVLNIDRLLDGSIYPTLLRYWGVLILGAVAYTAFFLPSAPAGRFSILTFRLEATKSGLALLCLFLITAFFLGLACLVFSLKEYILED